MIKLGFNGFSLSLLYYAPWAVKANLVQTPTGTNESQWLGKCSVSLILETAKQDGKFLTSN